MISMALGSRMTDAMSRVVTNSSAQMNNLSEKMLKVGLEAALPKGREAGKGEFLDIVA